MGDDLGAIDEDVPFDNAVADALISAADTAASTIEGQVSVRASAKSTALTDFQGNFAQLFRDNATVAAADGRELVSRLREVASGVRRLKEEARKEQERREVAREWKREHEDRNLVEQGWDFVTGGDDPPVGPPAAEPTIPVSQSVNGARQTPAPGSNGGGGGGTSSARPADLRSFATASRTQNNALRHKPAGLRGKHTDFAARCRWGRIDCDGVFTGFDRWLAANDEDVRWATLVADAFAAAGGEGNVSTVSNSALLATLQAHGVDASRDDIVIDPPVNYGAPPTTGYANDPVNTATGNFLEVESDLGFSGATSALELTRCYNSFNPGVGAFGPGWSSLTESGLTIDDEAARFRLPDGREVVFPRQGSGWSRAVGENLWLAASGTGLRITGNDGSWWECGRDGLLHAFGTVPGTTVRLVHEEGRLVRLEHERGRQLTLFWEDDLRDGGAARVTAAVASDGRAVLYGYDDGHLTTVTSQSGTRRYAIDEDGLIASVTDADGVVEAENEYDQLRRVVRQRSQFGRITRFAYLPGRVTVVSDEDGSRSNTWIADPRGRLVGVVDAEENRQSTSYDSHGNVVLVTERDGATTVHEYDERGRRTRTVTPGGADLNWGYDELDRVTTVVAEEGGVTAYSYEGEDRNPSVITDPEGGVTRLTWDHGLLVQVVDPTGVTVRFGYDRHGDLVAVSDALGNTVRTERDASGRVLAAVSASGARTSYDYSREGHVASRRDPDGALWRFTHTRAGRLASITDPLGARTIIERGSHGEEERTVDPLGRSISRHLDDLGNLAAVELADGSTWRFAHDALSRLVATTDPTGATATRSYDRVGDLVASVDGTGVRNDFQVDRAQGIARIDDSVAATGMRFDPLGRPTTSFQADGSSTILTYDRCGRPVEALDAEGGLTLIRRDPAGRPVEVTSPTGAVTRYEYDACGRPAAVVDPLGARSTIEYDADGRPVRRVLPTGEVAWSEYDACGRVVARFHPGNGIARYAYDAAGRLVRSSDTWLGRRKYRYDAAGQLIEVVNGNGGSTRFEYDANGRAVRITDPLGSETRREFDALNRCVAQTDPLGRTTRAGYDAAGRVTWQEDPDGSRLTWSYDTSGRVESVAVDGTTMTSISRDLPERSVTLRENTADGPVVHELQWNARGQLLRRSRDGRAVSWEYDADGRRTGLVAPDGTRTSYAYDAAGRLVAVDHPLLGRASFTRDGHGRVVTASAGGTIQSWEYDNGWLAFHSVTDSEGASRTVVARDESGRITRIDRDGDATSYTYDGANQLVSASSGDSVARWRYDAAGRLVAESRDGEVLEHEYDVAGQLLSTRGRGVHRTYGHDDLGRRVREHDDEGRARELSWTPTGRLASVTQLVDGGSRRTELHVDALGELAGVDGAEVFWDTAGYAGTPVQVGDAPVVAAGPVTGVGTDWAPAGWRTARSSGTDPWAVGSVLDVVEGPGIGIGASGELTVAGLEWMGARVYDPATRGFLSTDPLDPIAGSGWAGNPYSYAGNDPLHALDPLGLRPVTEAELEAYRNSNGLGGFVKKNWEYVAAAGMVIAGGVLIATGVGGPAGMMLISGGLDIAIQKATTGSVNWGQVAISTAFGAWGGVSAASKLGATTVLQKTVVGSMISGSASGGTGSAYSYLTGPGPHTPTGLLTSTVQGAGIGMLSGGAGGAFSHGADVLGRNLLTHVTPTPPLTTAEEARLLLGNPGDTVVLGRQVDTAVANGWDGHAVLSTDNWSMDLNDEFIRGTIEYQRPVYLASPIEGNMIQTSGAYSGQPTVFAHELQMLQDAGYMPDGDYLLPPR